ncbi:MAG: hypothetical protein H7Y03_03700 [Chitinophagaceae bacterium]|nr:hypothetical protein [Chitinophagaceae bacterium]
MKQLIVIIIPVFLFFSGVFAQPNQNFELKKPEKFENTRLASEKTGEKKFTAPRRFVQNTFTHYNYFFNANTRLDEILARAKASFRDDYTRLLPFYNYDLVTTAGFKNDLDSVIYKSTAGILLHDLRNSYIDNLYLLIGKSYYLRNELDSAYLTFQYLNYAFSPKEADGWDKVIGSNSNEGGSVFSVSTKEKKNIVHRALTRPPSRNESFIWQIRTYLAKNQLTEASGLIETLKADPLFPERLQSYLNEVQSLWFYKQNAYDSAAFYLEKALVNCETKQEQARWEYLIGQLYQRAGSHAKAQAFYNKATRHTIDPLLEVYSILNGLREGGSGNEQDVKKAMTELLKMGRKDKYFQYRDIVYYTAANIELEHNNPEAAKLLLLKSIKFSMNNPEQKSRSYLALGDMAYNEKNYVAAKEYYDSVNTSIIIPAELKKFTDLKTALDNIALQSKIVQRQDSLQRIAAMPEEERTVFLKALAKQLRRRAGLKERELQSGSGSSIDLGGNSKGVADLFGGNAKGEWYFNNANLKTKGYAEFQAQWGKRGNTDNWRRSSSTSLQTTPGASTGGISAGSNAASSMGQDISYEGLLATLPLTEELKKVSLDSTEHALFELGKAYQNGMEEYNAAISAYERMLSTFPATIHAEEAWYNLYYCYSKTGRSRELQQVKQTLAARFPNGRFNAKLNNSAGGISVDSARKNAATVAYDGVYDLFIEGRFEEALLKKKEADSVYGKNHWTPQLLYIEAIYHIRQRDDSTATKVLQNIMKLYAAEPLAERSKRLLDVLKRRQEIETYLTNLEIKRPEEDSTAMVIIDPVTVPVTPLKDTAALAVAAQPAAKDTLSSPAVEEVPEKEIRSARVRTADPPVRKPVATVDPSKLPSMDTAGLIKKPVIVPASYMRKPEQQHLVAFVMTKVDPVYVTEARNAFNRYNKDNYSGRNIESFNLPLSDSIKILVIQPFENAAAAFDYVDKAKKAAERSIIPWLKPDKYSIIMISEENLGLLKTRKDMDVYRRFLREAYPELQF